MLFSACNTDDEIITPDPALEIQGITATIGDEAKSLTRAETFKSTSVGRSTFNDADKIVFTKIERTDNPVQKFQYSNVHYQYHADKKNWKRVDGDLPEKLYWSDGNNDHTFIGYCLPQAVTYPFDNGNGTYFGKLSTTDFTTDGNTGLANNDILLTYSKTTKAMTGGLTTKVNLTHGLSNVCVVVNIEEYAASPNAVDTNVVVSDMIIDAQPTKFTWDANSDSLVADTDPANASLTLWCPKASGDGYGQTKKYSFYGLTVPHTADVPFLFKVKYDPNDTETKTYSGVFSGVAFQSGKCTTLNITLNHRDEQMHLTVDYSDWKYVASPDLGKLRKKSTFMEMTIDEVSIWTDGSSVDDATWLYNAGTTTDPVIKDIYGHTGTASDPYIIKSAAQLLSFAKEVNNGYDFSGKTIRLDADITMQESATATDKSWGGIGVGENSKPFNGTFLGGDRYINRLKGNPLFVNLGTSAVVEQLHIAPIGTLDGGGALAGTNAGTIGGCKVVDDIALSTEGGALVGTNNGTIHACYHIGNATYQKDKNTSVSLGLVGSNTGSIIGCYHAGDVFTIVTDNTGSTGTIECPKHESLYLIQQTAFVEALNEKLKGWYPEEETTYTKFQFKHNDASYPTVTKDKPNN